MTTARYIRIILILFALLLGVYGEAWAQLTTGDIILDEPFAHGTVSMTAVDAGTRTVTLAVTPASGYYVNKSDIVVQKLVDPSTPNARRRVNIADALTVSGNSTTTFPATGTYTFVVPNDYAGALVSVTFTGMNPATATVTPNSLTYTGAAQPLVTLGAVVGGAATDPVTYSLSSGGTYTTTIPTGTNAGTYTVYYKVAGDATHSEGSGNVTVTIQKATLSEVTLAQSVQTYTGSALTFSVSGVKAGTVNVPSTDYTISGNTQTDVGNYTLTVTAVEDASHKNFTGTATASYRIVGDEYKIIYSNTPASEVTNLAGTYILAADVDAGVFANLSSGTFTGFLDGDFHKITGLGSALFNTINNGTVRNVMLQGVNISSSLENVGAIANVAEGYSLIYNCGILPNDASFPEGTHPRVSTSGSYAGSIVGSLKDDSRVVNCFSYADVSSGGTAAGIVGNNTFASDASVTDGKYANLRTMVVNCMYYGDISASTIYPVYGGQKISNTGATAINNYNFYSVGCSFSPALTDYYCSWPAQLDYLTRYEFHRNLLNSNRELCGWWVGAPSAPSGMTTAEVEAVPKDASLIAKWVLDPAVAPYPILKPFGRYTSPVNIDADAAWRKSANPWEGKNLGTLNVSVDAGAHHTGTKSLQLTITDMDTLRADYCYRKVQLPYYNTVFGNPNGATWAQKYADNYGDYVVIGWKVSTTEGIAGTLTEDWQNGYNFADRNCTAKDANRVFAQGGYYYVPEGVTSITITAQWAQAVYFDNTDHSYDRVYMSGSKPGTHFAPAGYRPTTLGNGKTVLTNNLKALADNSAYRGTNVYEHAVVLVGNHQYRHNDGSTSEDIGSTSQGFTVIGADFDFDEEPDHCLIWQLGKKYERKSFCPIRFDFLPVVEIGLAMKEDGSTQYFSLGCYRPLGHFEVTETSLIRFGQFEFSNKSRSVYAPLILNGGIYEQYTKGHQSYAFKTADDKINYIIIGGNVRIPSFTPGAHVNSNANFPTRHCAVNVIGGNIDYLYLTGNYNEGVTPNVDNPHCYIDGGRFKQVSAAGKEGINGDVYFKINNSKIWEFYGGSTMDLSTGDNFKTVKGNIDVNINNSIVNKYCGGPKFGDMVYDEDHPENSKTITTTANNTIFTVYYGGGNGGTSYVQYDKTDVTTTGGNNYNWIGTGNNQGHLNGYTAGSYRSASNNYMANYDMEIVNVSTGTEIGEAVFRTYFYAAQFSATNTGPITNNLTDCTVLTNFYGGGNLGGVKGNVTSTLTGTHVQGSAFGAGFSANIPKVTIYNRDKTIPTINLQTGIITPTPNPDPSSTSTTYTWTNDATLSTSNPVSADGKYFYTNVPLINLGTVSGKATLNIEGTSLVEGNVYDINPDYTITQTGTNILGTFGGGDASDVIGDTEVKIEATGQKDGYTYNCFNVFGGGNEADVQGSTEVKMKQGVVNNNLFGGGNQADVTGSVSVDMTGGTVNKDVYGGGALANTNIGNVSSGYGTNSETISSTSTNTTTVNLKGGTIKGDAYGGGLGQLGASPVEAKVYGDITVNLGDDAAGPATAFNITNYTSSGHTDVVKSGRIFGANNLNGSPQGDVTVNVYKTVAGNRTRTASADLHDDDASKHHYEVAAVYGGGNLANYTASGKSTYVKIWTCDVSVESVYGGGNAAAAPATNVLVDGAHEISYVFGGGNGKDDYTLDGGSSWNTNNGADVNGSATTLLRSGYIHEAYGASNQKGTITGTVSLSVNDIETEGCPLEVDKLVGAGRNADINGDAITILGCMPSAKVKEIYGGADNANVNGNVELTITSGNFENVYGGNNRGGLIKGHIIVNIEETGCRPINIDNLYLGGNLAAYSVYGYYQDGTTYKPRTSSSDEHTPVENPATDATHLFPYADPILNVISCTHIGQVFGGGYGASAVMYGNPSVNINMMPGQYANDIKRSGSANIHDLGAIGDVYGGGEEANVNGNVAVNIGTVANVTLTSGDKASHNVEGAYITGKVFGGGKEANVSGNSAVTIGSVAYTGTGYEGVSIADNVYGGCNVQGTVGATTVKVLGGSVHDVFGGGLGQNTNVTNNVLVSLGDYVDDDDNDATPMIITGGATVSGDIYGGSAEGKVNNADASNTTKTTKTQVLLYAGTVTGDVYGGGLGRADVPAVGESPAVPGIAALVYGDVEVKLNDHSGTAKVGGSVFGCNNLKGTPKGTVTVDVYGTYDTGSKPTSMDSPAGTYLTVTDTQVDAHTYELTGVFGGGNLAAYEPETGKIATVNIYGCDASSIKEVYGGGNAAAVPECAVNVYGAYEIGYVYAGGKGTAEVAANVGIKSDGNYGTGNATTTINGGTIYRTFAGSNTNGDIRGTSILNIADGSGPGACALYLGDVFSYGNKATMSGTTVVSMGCLANEVGALYGGAMNANVNSDIALTINGGTYGKVFGGNKTGGSVNGSITVNIEETDPGCPINIEDLFGCGNEAPYSVYGTELVGDVWTVKTTGATRQSDPVINIYSFSNIGNVYGGGLGAPAVVWGNPVVNVNITKASGYTLGNVYGGGYGANVTGNTTVNIGTASKVNFASIADDLATTDVDESEVNVAGAAVSGDVFGGGYGHETTVSGTATINIGERSGSEGSYTYTAHGASFSSSKNIYGGSALGTVANTEVNLYAGTIAANVFGGGKGQLAQPEDISDPANPIPAVEAQGATISTKATVSLYTATVTGNIYGGCNDNGTTAEAELNLIGGTVGTSGSDADKVFGGGQGHSTTTTTATVNVGSSTSVGTSNIYSNVYGGSALGAVGTAVVNLNRATTVTGHVFGGGMGSGATAETAATVTTSATVNQNNITLAAEKDIYGGCNVNGTAAATTVNLLGGSTHDVFGGGLGQHTGVTGNVEVNVGAYDSGTDATSGTAIVLHDVYGGSAKGSVNTNTSNTTTVNLWAGTIGHDVFGGGLGDLASLNEGGDDSHTNIAAVVNGNVRVNLNGYDSGTAPDLTPVSKGTCVVKGSIYGCNNYNGSPGGTAEVHIYKTVGWTDDNGTPDDDTDDVSHERTLPANLSSATPSDHTYELLAVYGGGNQAAFTGTTTNVVIETCDPSIEDVYGGGNAADASNTRVEVKGAYEIGTVFGGGNGLVTAANVPGTATTILNGGRIHDFYGGSNSQGTIGTYAGGVSTGGTDITIDDLYIKDGIGCTLHSDNIYGAGKSADVDGGVKMTMGCLSDEFTIQNLYGGARAANIQGGVTLTVTSGNFTNVFGGNNESGSIGGPIVVNVEETGCKPLIIGNVYGGGNLAPYTGNPTVNLKSFTSVGNVYGGGLGASAVVTGNTVVNVNQIYGAFTTTTLGTIGNVYGGGSEASVDGNTSVNIGTAASVEMVSLDKVQATDGGGNLLWEDVDETIPTLIYQSLPVIGTNITGNVYGGGYGASTNVSNNVEVTIGATANTYSPAIGGDVYGGSALGTVNGTVAGDTYHTYVTLNKGAVTGSVYGGGLGDATNAALVNAPVTVTVNGGSAGNVFGCNNVNGAPQRAVAVNIAGGNIGTVYGGGNLAHYDYTGSALAVTMTGGTVGNLFGGGYSANVAGSVSVAVSGGTVTNDIYGGGALAHTNTANWDFTNDTWKVSSSTAGEHYEEVKHLTKDLSSVTGYYTLSGSTYTEVTDASATAVEGVTYYKQLPSSITNELYNIAKNGTTYNTTVSLTGGTVGNVYGGGLGYLEVAEVLAQPEIRYTAATAAAHNAELPGALNSTDPLTSAQATAYNTKMSASKSAGDILTPAEARAYNATLPKAVAEGDVKSAAVTPVAAVGTPAMVYGDVSVTVANTVFTNLLEDDDAGKKVVKTGRVFGGNNLLGTPKGSVTVTVTSTRRADGGLHADDDFEILAVYGGGNVANYKPETYDTDTEFGQRSHVIINGCDAVSIEKVYGGGNAASVPFTDVDIMGAYQIGYVFGGGNGGDKIYYNNAWHTNPGANVPGYANVLLMGGTIGQAFGGSDTKGSVGGAEVVQETGSCPLHIVNLYGAGNGEEASALGDIVVNMSGCTSSNIQKVFGGSYKANIKGSITLNITSGILTSVFGGNDRMGTVGGNITVNIEETEDCDNPIIIQNLYGGCYETDYPGTDAMCYNGTGDKDDPASYDKPFTDGKITVNVKSATRIDKVYGGSYKATVNGDTEVNINMTKGIRANRTVTLPAGYRGDNIPNLLGATTIYVPTATGEIVPGVSSVYGLYLYSTKTETDPDTGVETTVDVYTEIKQEDAIAESGVTYYELRQTGTIDNKIGTVGTIYGGGYQGDINGYAVVNIGTANEVEYETTPTHLTPKGNGKYDVVGAHITGDVYGGGNQAKVMEDTHVNFCTANYSGVAAFEGVSVENGTIYGGGRESDVLGDTYVTMSGGYVYNGVFGGGLAGSVGTYTRDKTQTTDVGTDVAFDHSTHTCMGKPTACTKGGKCTVVVDGGQIGPVEVATRGMTRPMSEDGPVGEGWVWGAGRGIVVDPKVDPDMHFKAYVNETDVTIEGSAFILASVIGGGEFGRVLTDTHVTIDGNCQIGVGADKVVILSGSGTDADPYVYGDPIRYTAEQWTEAEAAVKAGDASRINTIAAAMPECSHWDYGRDTNSDGKPDAFLTWDPYYDKYSAISGATTIGPASSSHASDGKTWIGCVFGGGSGYYPYEKSDGKGYGWVRSAGLVEGNTLLEIKGGHILTNVYGGNEYTDVAGKCVVKMIGGTIGVPRTLAQIKAHPLTCYLFGAGKGDPRPYFSNMTNAGSVEVEVSGGVIYGSVFGGSEDGHVLGDTKVTISDDAWIGTWGTSYVDGNVFGGGRGFSGETLTAGAVCGNTQVNITGGTMLGSIYGGGRLASVGSYLVAPGQSNYGKLIPEGKEQVFGDSDVNAPGKTHGHTTINISGGTIGNNIEFAYEPAPANRTNMPETVFDTSNRLMHTRGGNVFAGSMGRREGLDGSTAMTDWRKLGIVKSTKLNISDAAWIKGNVFGGGEFGAVTESHTTDGKQYGTEINISGGTIGTMLESGKAPSAVNASYIGTGSDSRYTFGSVYGGGYGTEAEATLTTNDVEAFGAFVNSNTYVKMTGGKVRASVYGGGEMACVKGDTYVDVSAGDIGINEVRTASGDRNNYVLFGSWRMGNVYGGGKGSTNAVYSGLVAGNTNVNISGGGIYHNVYGGGALSSVGTYTLATSAAPPIQIGMPNVCTAGGTATVTITGGTIGINGWDNGMVNGSSRGDISTNKPTGANAFDEYDNLGWVNNSIVTIGTSGQGAVFGTPQPQIKGTVYGGGENGHNLGNASVTVHSGTIGTPNTSDWENGNVFGSGCGTDTYDESTDAIKYYNPMGGRVRGNTTVLIDGGHILRNTYGGGSMASVDGSCTITVSGGRIGTDGSNYGCVYGGPKGNLLADQSAYVGSTAVNISYGTTPTSDNGTTTQLITNSVYGGGEAGIVYGGVAVNMNGGLVLKDVYGGGALANTNTSNWNASTNSWATSPSAMYNASTGTTHKSIVSLKGGTVQHNVYGGGLGRLEKGTSGSVGYVAPIAAKVYGDVLVKLNETTATDNCIVKGNIFGCNNLNGSPQSSVTVHVYKTQGWAGHDVSAGKADDSIEKTNTVYELEAVYGGGDLAMYRPDLEAVADTAKTYVIIDGCQLTSIQKVYGGGNAASVPASSVRVNGTYEISELFGGGNGKDRISYDGGLTMIDNPGANVGYINYSTLSGTTWTDRPEYDTKEERLASSEIQYGLGSTEIVVTGGKIHACYGGSDTKGNVRSSVTSSYEDAGECAPMSIDETYGGGKDAPMDADIEVNLKCAEDMAEIFGGSKNADLNSNVNLIITNGTYGKVFGGNNTSGAINGSITVTIEEKGCKPIIIGELYGGGYLAPYSVYGYQKTGDTYNTQSVPYIDTDGTTKYLDQRIPLTSGTALLDPRINIISATSIGTIYGGGYQAKVVGSPHINVNMTEGRILEEYASKETGYDALAEGTAAGQKDPTTGDKYLAIGTIGTIYGGGNMADVVGNTYVDIGTGSWVKREKNPSTSAIVETTETLTRKAATITGSVFGGGRFGHVGNFTFADAAYHTANPDVPVGKPYECASGTGECHVTISNGSIGPNNMQMTTTGGPDDDGHVFGAGRGSVDLYYEDMTGMTDAQKQTAIAALGDADLEEKKTAVNNLAYVNNTEVVIDGDAFVKGSVYGGGFDGHVLGDTHVTIDDRCQIGNGDGVNRPYTTTEWGYDGSDDAHLVRHQVQTNTLRMTSLP